MKGPLSGRDSSTICSTPRQGAIFLTALPQFIRPGDPPLRLVLMLLTYEAILLSWLTLYGALVLPGAAHIEQDAARRKPRFWTDGGAQIKLGARNRMEAARLAEQKGWL
jgi:hypothetical protein